MLPPRALRCHLGPTIVPHVTRPPKERTRQSHPSLRYVIYPSCRSPNSNSNKIPRQTTNVQVPESTTSGSALPTTVAKLSSTPPPRDVSGPRCRRRGTCASMTEIGTTWPCIRFTRVRNDHVELDPFEPLDEFQAPWRLLRAPASSNPRWSRSFKSLRHVTSNTPAHPHWNSSTVCYASRRPNTSKPPHPLYIGGAMLTTAASLP